MGPYFGPVRALEKGLPTSACALPPTKKGMSLFDFKISVEDCVENSISPITKIAFSVPVIVILCVVIRFRWSLRYHWFLIRSRTKRYASLQNDSHKCDAFVCYHFDDLTWVINNLLPNVEYKQGFKLCLHDRNWIPGVAIAENIVQSIGISRKTIVVVTNQFRPPIALFFRILQRNCGKYQCCGWRINFTYDYIALLFGVSVFSRLIAGAM